MSEKDGNGEKILTEKDIDSLFSDVEWYSKEVKVDLCHPDNTQERQSSQYSDDELINLANNIRTQGLQNPIQLSPDNKEYIVIAGQSRLNAYKWLTQQGVEGYDKIPARISREPLSEAQRTLLSSAENNQRKATSREDKVLTYTKIYNIVGKDLRLAAKICSVSQATITNYVKLAAVPTKVQKYFSDASINKNYVTDAFETLPPQLQDMSDDEVLKAMLPIVTSYQNAVTTAEKRQISKTIKANQPKSADDVKKAIKRGRKDAPIEITISLLPNDHEGIKELAEEEDLNIEDFIHELVIDRLSR